MPRIASLLLVSGAVACSGPGAHPAQASPAPDALVVEGLSGARVAPLEAPGASAVCLVFVAPDCPISNAYVPELERIQAAYAPRRVRLYLVHADGDLSRAVIERHRREFAITIPILLDRGHVLAAATGTTITPEAVVFTPAGELAYRGRIDDLYIDFGKRRMNAQHTDLRNALDAVLAGERPDPARTEAVGCFQAWYERAGHGAEQVDG